MPDVELIVASIETLIPDAQLHIVQTAYGLNKLSTFDKLSNGQSTQDLMASYSMVEHCAGNGFNISFHMEVGKIIREWYPHLPSGVR